MSKRKGHTDNTMSKRKGHTYNTMSKTKGHTDNTISKRKGHKVKQWSAKYYTENKKFEQHQRAKIRG